MSDKVELSTFPSTRTQALTMLYLEKQDFKFTEPEQLVDLYRTTYDKISKRFSETR